MPLSDYVTLSAEEWSAVQTATQKGHLARLYAAELLPLWRGLQDGIKKNTVDLCLSMLTAGEHPAVAAREARRQGAELLRLCGKVRAADPAIVEAAFATGGFTAAEVWSTLSTFEQIATHLRDTPADGSAVQSLCEGLAASLSVAPTILG